MRGIIGVVAFMVFVSCKNNKNIPDVSKIKIELTTQRFERDLFTIDTNQLATQLTNLENKYPSFLKSPFLDRILNVDPKWDAQNTTAYINSFIRDYKPVYDTTQKLFSDFSTYENEIKKGLQFVKFYFPEYKIPIKIITYIGPLDGYGDAITPDAIIIGLHIHLGKNSSFYNSQLVQATYPQYITNRFEPAYIVVNSMKNIVTDIYPEKLEDKSLVIQMVEKGKRLYMLNKLLPYTDENMLIGYTPTQMKDSYAHEAVIWDLFIQNNFLQTIDHNIIKNYIGESPKTQELGEASPGNIGSFAGWQIVKKYMKKYPEISLPQLMSTDAEKIFAEAKYKPE